MDIVACYKLVPDAQDIRANPGAAPDTSRAQMVIGDYDLMALEAAAQLAEQTEGRAVLLSIGGKALDDTKLRKAALSRGAEELFCVIDDEAAAGDAWQTASLLAEALKKIPHDAVICGEGSSDQYAQQVGPLLGAILGVPTLNAVSDIQVHGEGLRAQRTLEDVVETIDVPLPAVLCVTSDINLPRVPQLKDILAAGKKPVTAWDLTEVGAVPETAVEVLAVECPADTERKHEIYETADADSIGAVAAALKAAR